jgi:hypothetical protein
MTAARIVAVCGGDVPLPVELIEDIQPSLSPAQQFHPLPVVDAM